MSLKSHSSKLSKTIVDDTSLDEEKSIQKEEATPETEDEDEEEYLSGIKLGLIVLGLCLAVLLIGLVCYPHLMSRKYESTNQVILGQFYSCNSNYFLFDNFSMVLTILGHPDNHNCIQLTRRCWLVRLSISHLRVSAHNYSFATPRMPSCSHIF